MQQDVRRKNDSAPGPIKDSEIWRLAYRFDQLTRFLISRLTIELSSFLMFRSTGEGEQETRRGLQLVGRKVASVLKHSSFGSTMEK